MTTLDTSPPYSEPHAPDPPDPNAPLVAEKAEAHRLMISGAAIGVLDVLAIAALGVGCPLCAVGAPALVGWGAWRWYKVRKLERASQEDAADEPPQDGATSPR